MTEEESARSQLREPGFSWFDEYIYTSALLPEQLREIRDFLQTNNFINVDAALVRTPVGATRLVWITFYNEVGAPMATGASLPIPENSNHLKLVLGYSSEKKRSASHSDIAVIVNQLRLFFGFPVAHELVSRCQFDALNTTGYAISPAGYHSYFGAQHINEFPHTVSVRPLSVEASILLSKAFEQKYPSEQFVLLWLAFEALVNAFFPGGANGSKRQTYFREVLGSDTANEEVFRLFKIRSDLFKEGKISEEVCGEACWSLYMAIQLLTLNEGELRDGLVRGYEAYISRRLDAASREIQS